ncbi:transcriptional regulator family: Fungal Specific TF [Aspergillus niger]|uniref:transcription factor domain-containing protein n=1 Tax=Aspergillus lacticoffeatus (strain CBS 101883) TaxID=1450533 RepID=UPI000D7EC1BB|nr:Zn(II)2Cys6 transcription factor [Aspergillus niger CBS 101883]KAI2850926.1 transcriptional regulator family: Fungal Specific TF [Aspergillus niger]KAI2867773.1 transcriptional regulator family: Fungal Specific TF [Aspergillus niger]KAI2892412.1 transcriptional regulator family: Fungal Specific TF [Aspergillus niger]KAI2897278.1 transcriptional regulator family: Fungal Specific TF [Aspergillus niger]KAI2917770.1 transcriptional regulator family: Fungal Specific TF [Aspergillus niger]
MSRPQVSIDRLTPRRVHAEPRESMNCKSCRKRKIKCNRLRPSCEACKVFQCPCIYDAVPKKRGPKTDVLEALLKRVDGLEKRLQEDSPISPTSATSPVKSMDQQLLPSASTPFQFPTAPHGFPPPPQSQPPPQQHRLPDAMLDTYFTRLHGKPYWILDETATRQRHQHGQLPMHLSMAIYALTLRYTTPNPPQGSLEYARQARRLVDIDNPSIEGTQSLLLLCHTFFAYGCGKTAYMVLANAVSMTLALDLYREAPAALPAAEREMRRRLFWTVYVMDRFLTCGSKRPCLIADHSIVLRLPGSGSETGEWFNPVGPNIHYSPDRRKGPGGPALLVDITRILGVTHRYLAAGGVKGDSHFPWHALSNLSKIRQELDLWAAGTQDLFASIETLFGHPESTLLLLSKLIYHLVHCLLYRPFLPIDLVELRGTGQHQSWQIEATTLCFSHANAIAELVELARHAPRIEWPALVAYCVCTAGTVHVHGVHYHGREGEVFASSADFLAREMHQLSWLRQYWAGVQHQREMLQSISACHAELVRTMAARPVRFAPVFHLEDFLDRYPGLAVDGAHLRLVDGDEPLPLDRPDFNRLMYPPASTLPSQGRGSISFQPSPTWPQPELALPESSLGFSPGVSNSPAPFLSDPFTAPTPPAQPQYATFPFEATPGGPALTPDAPSQGSSSATATGTAAGAATGAGEGEKDPFLSLLEQLAENEHSQGGPSELDFFLGEGLDMVMPEVEVENP